MIYNDLLKEYKDREKDPAWLIEMDRATAPIESAHQLREENK